MPTKTQCQELLNNTVHTTATISNINGIMFYKSNDTNNYVFIPLAGYKTYTTLAVGTNASIWTSTPGEETGSAMIFRMNDTDNPYF